MKYIKPTKKLISVIALLGIILTGAYFVLGEYGQSGPESASNLEEYGLVGHWTFEEGSGQTIYDRSGNGNDGTLGANDSVGKDDPVFAAGHDSNGPEGLGMSFDGVDDYVDVLNNDSLNFGAGDFSLSAWIKTQAVGKMMSIIMKGKGGSGGKRYYFMIDTDNELLAEVDDNVVKTTIQGAIDVNDGIFHHIVFVADRSGNGQIYLDGQADGAAVSLSSTSASIDDTSYPLTIARDSDLAQRYFNGIIDSVRIYNRALSADEIRMLYNQKKPVMELKFDEGSGTTAHDESWNGNDVTFPVADGNKPEWSAP